MLRRLARCLSRRHSVADDWMSRLPESKNDFFELVVRDWESAYAMISIALNEALALRAEGKLVAARQQAGFSGDLLEHLAEPLSGMLRAMGEHGRHFGTLSCVSPLNPDFFRGEKAQRAASWNLLFHRVLLSDRSRLFHKLATLASTIDELAEEFRRAALEICESTSTRPSTCWSTLDSLHYDLNTCLRESIVLLKSFLCALPAEELDAFRRRSRLAGGGWGRRARQRLSRAST